MLSKCMLKEGKKSGEKEGQTGGGREGKKGREGEEREKWGGDGEASGFVGFVKYHLENMNCVF